MKKIIYSILLIFLFIGFLSAQSVFADDKITSVNYDISANMLFLTSGNSSNTEKNPIKLVKLSNPNRVYFDIENSVLTTAKQDFQVTSGGVLRQVVVSQNSTNPNVVRVVMYFAEAYNTSNLKIMRLNGNIIVQINNDVCALANYMHEIYRDTKYDSNDYYSFVSMTSQQVSANDLPLTATASNAPEKVLNQIQQAFENSTVPVSVKSSYQNANVSVIKKNFKLKSKYYLTGVQARQNGILISGYGTFTIEKPMVLPNPNRLVLDFANTVSSPAVRSKTFKYGEDTIRVGQFEANRARIVITTPNADRYIPVYSADGQSVLIADKENLSHDKLSNITTNLVSTRVTKTNEQNYGLNLYFSKPVVYSVKRDANNLTLYMFNALQYNDQDFRSVIKGSSVENSKIYLMPRVGLRYSIPLDSRDTVKVYTGTDARTIKIAFNSPSKAIKRQPTIADTPTTLPTKVKNVDKDNDKVEMPKITPRKNGERVVVIDPGHGGKDYGAIRAGINEKDITLDVSKLVAAMLRAKGYKVYMSHDTDKFVPLQGIVDIAEEVKPDLFVSIHVNSSNGTEATGIETHYYHEYSIGLAKSVHNALMAQVTTTKDRGLFKSRFYVINHTTMPAILVEIGFISNDNERAELVSEKRKQATARGITNGIINYYKQQQK